MGCNNPHGWGPLGGGDTGVKGPHTRDRTITAPLIQGAEAKKVMTGFGREQQPEEDCYLNRGVENSNLAPTERHFNVYRLYVLGG